MYIVLIYCQLVKQIMLKSTWADLGEKHTYKFRLNNYFLHRRNREIIIREMVGQGKLVVRGQSSNFEWMEKRWASLLEPTFEKPPCHEWLLVKVTSCVRLYEYVVCEVGWEDREKSRSNLLTISVCLERNVTLSELIVEMLLKFRGS